MAVGTPGFDRPPADGSCQHDARKQRRQFGSAEGVKLTLFRSAMVEGARYLGASALALALDFGVFMGLHRLAGLDYRIAAPVGFTLGLVLIYVLSIRLVFRQRRLKDARAEFILFA